MRIPKQSIAPKHKWRIGANTQNSSNNMNTPEPIRCGLKEKENKNMIVAAIPKEICFDLPIGRFKAVISNIKPFIKQASQGPQDWIRILFDVQVPGISERAEAKAGRNFRLDLRPGSELRNWLTGLLGRTYFNDKSGETVSLDSLVGTECEIELTHFQGDGFKRPMVIPANIYPPLSVRPAIEKQEESAKP